jgi:hypothetical protein
VVILNFVEEKHINPKTLPTVTNFSLGRMYLGAAYFLKESSQNESLSMLNSAEIHLL